MTKHIHWLLDVDDGSYDAVTTSPMASQRLRAGCMMRSAKEHLAIVTAGCNIPPNCDSLIVGKIGIARIHQLEDQWLESISQYHASGKQVFLDFTDNHLDCHTEMTHFYSEALKVVDHVVCSSDLLVSTVRKYFDGPIHLIPDPIEITPIPPKTTAFWPRTILWFGHSTNLPYLVDFLPMLQAKAPLRLIILSDSEGIEALERANVPRPDNLAIELRSWGKEAMLKAAAESDCCIIPSYPQDPRKAGASSNRLLTALALGLPTIASGLASYQPFAQYFNQLNSNESINVIIDPCAFSKQVLRAQDLVIPKYTMESVGAEWFNLQPHT